MKAKDILYIIDGSSYIFRAYYATPPLSNSEGLPTNATYGFTQMLMKLLEEVKPEHLVMVFDAGKESFRHKIYPKYKANRGDPPEDLIPQFQTIREVVEALNIPVLEKPGFEADDIIATLIAKPEQLPAQVDAIIVSSDKDLLQLVDGRVKMWDTMKGKHFGAKEAEEKFGVPPEKIVEVQALMGDSVDNIPGVPGIGPKTAASLIQTYGSLEKLYAHLGEIKGKQKEKLEQNRELALISHKLVELKKDVPLKTSFKDYALREPQQEKCQKLFERLEFHRFLNKKSKSQKTLKTQDYELVQEESSLKKLISALKAAGEFAVDTESTSLNLFKAHLVGLSFSLDQGQACYIPVGHETKDKQLAKDLVLKELKPVLQDPKLKKYFQNYKYDQGLLAKEGIEVEGLAMDTLVAAYLLDSSGRYKLDMLSLKYLQHQMISFEEVVDHKKEEAAFAKVSLKRATTYAAEDAEVTFRLAKIFEKDLAKEGLKKLYENLEQPLIPVLAKMERVGVLLDQDFLKDLQEQFAQGLEECQIKAHELAGQDFNLNSPKQLQEILFDKLGLKPTKKTKTGYSTDVEVLQALAHVHPLPETLLRHRTLSKLKSTYVDALLTLVEPSTGRIHTSFNQTVAETGRLSSSDPNLQNIPIKTPEGAQIRRAFIAEKGFILLSADYSQIELRVLAELSGDKALRKAFEENLDIHSLTAANIFNVPEAKVDAQMRSVGKTINFAVIYGKTVFGLSQQLGIPQKEAKA
ncbi:MAG: DNA polymerase I, partial [Deltaproteobacteria bacterium]|nr:DNA polymerase I [Deltaproteobacteria bacterium]